MVLNLKKFNFYRETLLLSFYLFNCTFNNIPLKSSFTLHTKKKKLFLSFVLENIADWCTTWTINLQEHKKTSSVEPWIEATKMASKVWNCKLNYKKFMLQVQTEYLSALISLNEKIGRLVLFGLQFLIHLRRDYINWDINCENTGENTCISAISSVITGATLRKCFALCHQQYNSLC